MAHPTNLAAYESALLSPSHQRSDEANEGYDLVPLIRSGGEDQKQQRHQRKPQPQDENPPEWSSGSSAAATAAASCSPATPKQARVVDVLVVGAGISGLSAVDEMQRQHSQLQQTPPPPLSILVLEANARVGGRCYSDDSGCDLGGAYFGPMQDRILSVIDDLGLKLKKVNTEQKTVSFVNGKVDAFEGVIPPVGPFVLLDVNAAMVEIDRIAETVVDVEHPERTPDAARLDSITFAQLANSVCWTETAKRLMATALRAVLCKEPHELSVLAWCWYVKLSGNIKRIMETKDGAQDSNVVGGAGQIPKLLAKKITSSSSGARCELLLSQPVRSIASDPAAAGGHCIVVETPTLRVAAKTVILAIPPPQQARIMWCDKTARLTPIRRQALENASFGCVIKTFTFYAKPYWREHELSGSIVADGGIAPVCIESVQGAAGEEPRYAIMAFILGAEAVRRSLETKEQRRDALCQHFKRLFGDDERMLSPVDYKEHNWGSEPFLGGAVAMPSVGALTKFGPEWMRSQLARDAAAGAPCGDRIFIAGTESARRFNGYMDGAVEAGVRSGRNALVRIGMLERAAFFDKVSDPPPSVQMPFVEFGLSTAEKRCVPSVGQLLFIAVIIVVAVVAALVIFFVAR